MRPQSILKLLWGAAAALLLTCVFKVGFAAFFGSLERMLLAGLLVTVLLYFHDRVQGKNAFIGPVLIEPGHNDGLTRYVDFLSAALGLFSAGYLLLSSFGYLAGLKWD